MSALPTSSEGEELYASLLHLTDQDPYVRWHISPDRLLHVRRHGDATVWSSRRHGPDAPVWLQAMGDPNTVAELVLDVATDLEAQGLVPRGATLPRDSFPLLPDHLRGDHDEWDWWFLTQAPPVQRGEAQVRWLDDVDPARIKAFLEAHSPRHSASPGDPHVQRWAGVVDGQGELLATAAHEVLATATPHLASVATHTGARGQGWGGAVTAWISRQLLADAGVVTLGMYADNEPARRVYRRLGFVDRHRWTSMRWS
ncbi:MAG: GNAT family N-acetyltransferase [Motilibacteraceae bacterium]